MLVADHGDADQMRVAETAAPGCGPGETVVRVAAAGLNFIDVYQRRGDYPQQLPYVAGLEGAGEVVEVGSAVDDVRPGDRVAWVNVQGAMAEFARVPVARLVPVPADVPLSTAAAVLLQGMTAHYLSHDVHPVGKDTWALVHAVAGGTGLVLAQVIQLCGGTVIGTVSTEEKARRVRSRGIEHVVVRTEQDPLAEVRRLTDGRGVDVVYDGVGGPTFDSSLAAVRTRGTLAVFGMAGGPVPLLDVQSLNRAGSIVLQRPNLDHFIADPRELRERARQVFAWVAERELQVDFATAPLNEVSTLSGRLEAGDTVGKAVLLI